MWINDDEIINKHPKCIGSEKERERDKKRETRMHRLAPRDRLCSWNMGMISQVNHIQAVLVQVSNTQQIKLMKRYTSGVKKGPISINVGKKMRTQWFRIVVLPSTIC